jgi:hypothetical protein
MGFQPLAQRYNTGKSIDRTACQPAFDHTSKKLVDIGLFHPLAPFYEQPLTDLPEEGF